MSDLVEKVAKAICESEDGGVWEQHRWDAGSYWHNEYERMARAAIAVVVEEAAKVAEGHQKANPNAPQEGGISQHRIVLPPPFVP